MSDVKIGGLEIDNIYCGDALKLMKENPGNSIDLIVTDPPLPLILKSEEITITEHNPGF